MDSTVIVCLIIVFVCGPILFIWGLIRKQRRQADIEQEYEQKMAEIRERSILPTSYDEIMERFREVGTDVDGILERLEKDVTDPEFLPTSEQDYVDALAARYQNAGYKIISHNCGSPGADMIMRRDGYKIIIEAKLHPKTQNFYSAIGQVLRYGVENNGTILAIACFSFGYLPMPKWFTSVCKKYDIYYINALSPGIENLFTESPR